MPNSFVGKDGRESGGVRCKICGTLLRDEATYARHLRDLHKWTTGELKGADSLSTGNVKTVAPIAGSSPVVFISHSHVDRAVATRLQRVLEDEHAVTYLDQDQIQAADLLPQRIRDGIESCTALLLLWSASAAASSWVHNEWELAYDRRKKIIPYLLDGTHLPPPLDNLVYVDQTDAKVANANLLKAIFGGEFKP